MFCFTRIAARAFAPLALAAAFAAPAVACPNAAGHLSDAGVSAAAEVLPEVTLIETGTTIADRELVGEGARFEANGGRVYARIVVDNPGPEAALAMVWRRDGRIVQSLPVNVGTSPRWRTWSYKTMRKHDAGKWTVEVLDAEGTAIAQAAFEVVAPTAAVSLAPVR